MEHLCREPKFNQQRIECFFFAAEFNSEPFLLIYAMQFMFGLTKEAKMLDIQLDFERDLWHLQSMGFAGVPKKVRFDLIR